MKSIIPILCLLIMSFSFAQNDTILMDDVIISNDRIKTSLPKSSTAVTIITQEEIEKYPAKSIEEILSHYSSVDIRRRGISGVQSDISIRGGSFEQVLVLINGVKMSDPQTGHHNLNLPIDVNNIAKIEIIKGPAARRYGQNAYAGVINITTKEATKNALDLKASYGSFNSYEANASLELKSKNITNKTNLQYASSDGYRHNTDYTIYSIFNTNEFNLAKQKYQLNTGFTEKKFGANGFYANATAVDQYEETQTSLVSLNTTYDLNKWNITPRLYWRRNQDEYLFVRNKPEIYRNLHISNTLGVEVNSNYTHKLGQLGLGIEAKKDIIRSNNLGNRERNTINLFAENKFQITKKIDATLGILLANYSDFGTFAYPGVDLGYAFNSKNKIFTNWGITARVPSYTDLFYEDPANLGNPNLKPERANNFELGYKNNGKNHLFTTSLFYRHTSNLIDWIKEKPEDQWQPVNILSLNTKGLETELKLNFNNPFLKNLNLSYTYIDNEPVDENENQISRYVLDNLNHKLNINLVLEYFKNFTQTTSFTYADRETLTDYSLLDIKWMYSFKNFNAFFDLRNVTNISYTETNLVPMPGRYFNIGITLKNIDLTSKK